MVSEAKERRTQGVRSPKKAGKPAISLIAVRLEVGNVNLKQTNVKVGE